MTRQPEPDSLDMVSAGARDFLASLPSGARILIIRLRSLGDTVLLTPTLRLLHEWRPDLRVTVLLDPPWDGLLRGNPAVDEVLAAGGKLATLRQIRQRNFAAVINLHGGPTSTLDTRWSGVGKRAGFAHYRNTSIYTTLVPTAQEILGRSGQVHTAEHVASCFFHLGVPQGPIPRAEVFASEDALERVGQSLEKMGVRSDSGYAVVHPTATFETKRWSASGFAKIAAYLESSHGMRAVFIGTYADAAVISAVERSSSKKPLSAVGWPLDEVVALIAGAKLFIGNDSGPAHIAAAAGVPVAAIFGSSNSTVWGPWQAVDSEVVQNDFACNPCAGDRCYEYEEPRCIQSITVEQVRAAVDRILAT